MKHLHRFYLLTMAIMGMTILHHFYGSLIYPQHFRMYTALFAVPVVLAEWIIYRMYSRRGKRLWLVLFQVITIIFPVLFIGLYEGIYNHVLKNILFFGGLSTAGLLKLFPPPMYEMPDNFFFEFTGCLQGFLLIAALVYLVRYYSDQRQMVHPL
ncbi:hypothetical protein [Chitinophaga sp. Cy-1792]|uniref:hypothetical protein n=1 Tax=Chitinophaga sp. Cy-1792 TaxID=2608339 RepID=UPI0014246524|nr:hypothetical protein [Chitinophaga sp. Cy-1792]NIG55759.1 hypothetical protein [Chitinophaga sp. Cy-1792]